MLLWPIFFFSSCAHHRALHSFPTRRSSDLARFEAAYDFVRQTVAQGESVLFVGTKRQARDRKSTRLNSSHITISYAVFCLKKKKGLPIVSHFCSHDFRIIEQHVRLTPAPRF